MSSIWLFFILYKEVNPIKIDIQLGKRVLSFGGVISKYSDPRMNPRFWPNTPQPFAHATDTFRNTTEQLKAYQGWVGDCVSLIAERIASIPLRLYDKNDELIKEHPFYDMLKHFNPDTTQFMGKEFISTYQDLTGECYILMAKDGLGIPRELYFRSPAKTRPDVDKVEGIIKGYKWLDGVKEVTYPREDVLFFRYPNPTDPFRGCSPVQRKAWAYDTDLYNMIYQRNIFKNGVHLKQVLQTEENMDQEQINKILDIFDATYGGIENTSKTGALVGGMKLETVGVSNKDMEFMSLAKWTMQQIASAYHVPPQKLSHPEQTNLANMKALDVSWNRECILPRLVRIAEIFNTFLLPLYKDSGLYCKFDNPVPADDEFLLKKRESDLKTFVISPNEARIEDGLDEVPWGKVPLAPFNIMPLGSAEKKVEPALGKEQIRNNAVLSFLREYSEEFRREYWEQFIKRVTPLENDFKRGMIKLFQEQELRALRALRKKKSMTMTKDVDDVLRITHDEREIAKFAEFTIPRITEMVKINGTNAYAELGVSGSFDVSNPKVIKWIKKRCGFLIKSIGDTTLKKLKKTLAEGVQAGESIPSLASRVSAVYDEAKGYRAIRIARTETMAASNQGALQAYDQSGVVEKKEWLVAGDACGICLDIAAEGAIGLHESFSGGFDTPPAHPNCRCTILPVIEK